MTDFFVLMRQPTIKSGGRNPLVALGPYGEDAAVRLALRLEEVKRDGQVYSVVPEGVEVFDFPVDLHEAEDLGSALLNYFDTIPGKADPRSKADPRPLHVQMFKDAVDVVEQESYTFEDLLDVATAEVKQKQFAEWVVARFYEEAEAGTEFEVVDGRLLDRMTTVERPTGGWVSWSMQRLTAPRSIAALIGQGEDEPFVRMEKYTADDRGPGSRGPVVAFPLDLLFGDRKRNAEYEEYLRLKAKFEPSTGGSAV